MLNYYNDTRNNLHGAGYPGGILNSRIIEIGMEAAKDIIKAIRPPAKQKMAAKVG